MLRAHAGYATFIDPDRPLTERDTLSCGHCSAAIFVKPHTAATVYVVVDPQTHQWREEAGAFCRICMRPVCLACHAIGTCTPLERRLEHVERR